MKRQQRPKKQFEILGVEYTRAKIAEKIKEIKQTHAVGAVVGNEDGEFLKEIFKMHPNYAEKTQNSHVVSISHEKAQGNTTCFYFCTETGIKEDFSILKCTQNITQYQKARIVDAYRNEIRNQITQYKETRGYGITQCDLCANVVGNYNWETGATHVRNFEVAGHVDHDKNCATFAQMLTEFFNKYGTNAAAPVLIRQQTEFNTLEWVLEDSDMKFAWAEFHRERAKFRFLCPDCNCSAEKKK